MSGDRILDFQDTFTSASIPEIEGTSRLIEFVDNAAYEAVYGAGVAGSIYMNTTFDNIFFHDGNSWKQNEAELNSYGNAGVPTVNDDETLNFSIGSVWEYDSRFWICKDNTTGAAVWIEFAQNYDGDISGLQSQINDNDSDISTLQTDVSTNTGNIATNTSNIATNTANIANNDANIINNTIDISNNAGDIATNQGEILLLQSDVSTLQTDVGDHETRISTLESIPATQTIGALDIDWSLANVFQKAISTNETYTFSNDVDGKTIVVMIHNNSGADVDVDFPTAYWSGGTEITTVPAGTRNVYTFIKIGTDVFATVNDNMTVV